MKNKTVKKSSVEDNIKKSLEKIRPALQMDGGDVEFVNFNEKTGVVSVRLVGMCAHCMMSQITLKQGIEETIKNEVAEVKEVIAV